MTTNVDVLIGKRVLLINPGGYSGYAGTVRGRYAPLKGSTVYDEWADIDWDTKVHPCTNPIEVKHLRLINAESDAKEAKPERGTYWCCKAPFGEHDDDCPNKDQPSSCTVDSVVHPMPDYKLSFGGRFSIELEEAGYNLEGTCQMDNGVTGVVYCRRPNAMNKAEQERTNKH